MPKPSSLPRPVNPPCLEVIVRLMPELSHTHQPRPQCEAYYNRLLRSKCVIEEVEEKKENAGRIEMKGWSWREREVRTWLRREMQRRRRHGRLKYSSDYAAHFFLALSAALRALALGTHNVSYNCRDRIQGINMATTYQLPA